MAFVRYTQDFLGRVRPESTKCLLFDATPRDINGCIAAIFRDRSYYAAEDNKVLRQCHKFIRRHRRSHGVSHPNLPLAPIVVVVVVRTEQQLGSLWIS